MLNLANEGQRDINNNTWAVTNAVTIPVTQNTTYYALPSDFLTPVRVTYAFGNLTEQTLISLDSLNQSTAWETQGNGPPPQYYFFNQSTPTAIGIYPFISTYTASNALDSLRVQYYAQPADMVLTTDIPFNGIVRLYPYHMLIELYVAYRVYLIEGEVEKANAYMQEYTAKLGVMNSDVGKKVNYIPGMSGPANSR